MEKIIICIGREYGSGGREVAEKLAGKLNIPCYDKLLVKRAAQASGLSETFISREEETPSNFMRFLSGNIFADCADLATAFYSDSQMVYDAERAAIVQLANQDCVIVGRCASSILKTQGCLSVFIYADGNDRCARVMKRNGLTAKAAEERIRRIDRLRRQYFDFYSDTHWGQPESYDLMISSSRYGVSGCVDLIAESLERLEGGIFRE